MFNPGELPRFIENLIDGLLRLISLLVRNWTLVAIRPFRGSLRLASSSRALSSQATLFVALLFTSLSGYSLSNIGEAFLGRAFTPNDLGDRFQVIQPGGIWYSLGFALLTYAFLEMFARLLAWTFVGSSRPHATRRATKMIRYGFAAGSALSACLSFAIFNYVDYSSRFEILEWSYYLDTIMEFYPVLFICAGLAGRLKSMRNWVVRALWLLLPFWSYHFSINEFSRLTGYALWQVFRDPLPVADALRCTRYADGILLEGVLSNPGTRPFVLDWGMLELKLKRPLREGADREVKAGLRTMLPSIQPDLDELLEKQSYYFDEQPLVIIGSGSAVPVRAFARANIMRDTPDPYECSLTSAFGRDFAVHAVDVPMRWFNQPVPSAREPDR